MPLLESHYAEALAAAAREGSPRLIAAPTTDPGPTCPAAWRSLLQHPDPARQAMELLWSPLAPILPRTIAAWKRSIQGLALLTSGTRPPSLLYFYRRGDEAFAYRGFSPRTPAAPAIRPESARLPAEFLSFYRIHDGFTDLYSGALGPLPEAKWFRLGDDPTEPAASFLVVFSNGGGAHLGFDLSEPAPLAYIVWPDDPPTLVPDVWPVIDEWMAAGLEGADPA